jgi:hypothetical protein
MTAILSNAEDPPQKCTYLVRTKSLYFLILGIACILFVVAIFVISVAVRKNTLSNLKMVLDAETVFHYLILPYIEYENSYTNNENTVITTSSQIWNNFFHNEVKNLSHNYDLHLNEFFENNSYNIYTLYEKGQYFENNSSPITNRLDIILLSSCQHLEYYILFSRNKSNILCYSSRKKGQFFILESDVNSVFYDMFIDTNVIKQTYNLTQLIEQEIKNSQKIIQIMPDACAYPKDVLSPSSNPEKQKLGLFFTK